MARSSTLTILELDRYAKLMGLDPIHFSNLDNNTYPDNCKDFWNQTAHDEVAAAIAEAEEMMRRALGYDVAPVWRQDRIDFNFTARAGHPWWYVAAKTPYGHVQEFGTRVKTLISANAAVVLAANVGTVTVATTVTDTDEIRIYYRVADGALTAGDDRYEIRPTIVTIAGGTATIRAPQCQFAELTVLDAVDPSDYTVAGNFVAAVDVYRVYNDPSLPLSFLWDGDCYNVPYPDSSAAQDGAARLIDPALGRFEPRPATWNATTLAHSWAEPLRGGYPPELIIADYHAGYPRDGYGNMDIELERATLRLANTLLPQPPCNYCDMAMIKWNNDRTLPDPLTEESANNPFGPTNGGLYALRVVRRRALVGGGLV